MGGHKRRKDLRVAMKSRVNPTLEPYQAEGSRAVVSRKPPLGSVAGKAVSPAGSMVSTRARR